MYHFANDAKVYKSTNTLNDHDILQHDIAKLTKWSSDWLLTFYPDKCKVLKVVKNTFMDYDYVMQKQTLQFISQEKDLGVILCCHLMNILITKSAKRKKYWDSSEETTILNEVTLVQLYNAFVRCHFEY